MDTPATTDLDEAAPPRRRRRLSAGRIVAATAGLTVVGIAGSQLVSTAVDSVSDPEARAWFAPYVDTTLTPIHHFEDPTDSPSDEVVLGFVVASASGTCTPTWGTHYTLDDASIALELDRRLLSLRQRGGDAIVSFGGAINDELALRCEDADTLADAYRAVIERYSVTTLDFDIEGAALGDTAANERRATAVAALQAEATETGDDLAVWLTLPVLPSGLTAEGLAVVDAMLAGGVDLAGVNVMAMNYGQARPAGTSMWKATEQALESTMVQLRGAYSRAGVTRSSSSVWHSLGVTPMIGRNDAAEDVFDLADADSLLGYVTEHGLGRVSMWSANRDVACGAQLNAELVSNTCSGVPQERLEFTQRFATLPGRAVESAAAPPVETAASIVDDPENSPYPIWREQRVYEAATRVVWHGDVYEAKWWTEGAMPDAPVANVWDSPWRYIGPVLPTDQPHRVVRLPEGTYPDWTTKAVYDEGDRVLLDGVAYEAKWWTQGDRPDPDVDRPWDTPWSQVEVLPSA